MRDEISVLVLNCEFPPLGGGAATATAEILREFERMPVHARLVTASVDGAMRSAEYNAKCRIDYIPVGKIGRHYWRKRELAGYAVGAYAQARRLVRRGEKFDVCHAFFTLPAGAAAYANAGLMPYVVSLRGSDVPGFSGRFGWMYRYGGGVFRAIWRKAAAVAANSEELRQLALEAAGGGLEIEVIPNGVDLREFHPGEVREKARTVLAVARLVPRKDLETAVRATAVLAREFPEARLVIVGEGPEEERLAALARERGVGGRVELRGGVPRERMAETYREADVFISTSRREGMSNTVLEAMASGLPVVASRGALAGIEGLVEEAPTGGAEAAAQAVGRYFRDAGARKAAARVSREAAERYTWGSTARAYYNLYRSVVDARAEGGAETDGGC